MVKRALATLALMLGCGDQVSPITELVLVADSDLALDRIVFEVSQGANVRVAEASRTSAGPSYVSLVRDQGSLGPLTVVARGLRGDQELLQRVHEVSFVPDESRMVRLDLYAQCASTTCAADQTCGPARCQARKLDELPPWTGSVPALPAPGPPDAGVLEPDAGVSEADAGNLQRCGPMMMTVDVSSDPAHCGTCGNKCKNNEACAVGVCTRK